MTQNETESVNDMILLLNSEASDVEVAAKIVETLEAVPTEGIKPWLKAFVSSAGETDRLRHVNNLMTKGELGGRWGSIVRRMSDRDQELTKGEERALMQSRWGEGKSRIVLCQDGKILEGFPTWPRTA